MIACFSSPVFAVELEVSNPYVRATPPGKSISAAYVDLKNTSSTEVILVGAKSPLAKSVEIHEHVHKDGMMGMRQVESITLAAKGSLSFSPGSYHFMLFGLKQALKPKGTMIITLCYSDGSEQAVQFEIMKP